MATLIRSIGAMLKYCDSLTFLNGDGDADSPEIVVRASRLSEHGLIERETSIDLRLSEMCADEDAYGIAEISVMLEGFNNQGDPKQCPI